MEDTCRTASANQSPNVPFIKTRRHPQRFCQLESIDPSFEIINHWLSIDPELTGSRNQHHLGGGGLALTHSHSFAIHINSSIIRTLSNFCFFSSFYISGFCVNVTTIQLIGKVGLQKLPNFGNMTVSGKLHQLFPDLSIL